ncbi:MAG: methyltransferase domain-containing protein [Planctomycetota bacterium]
MPATTPATLTEQANTAPFDTIYADAEGQLASVPWQHLDAAGQPCPCAALLAWLHAEAGTLLRPGVRVAIVGCGLGEDAKACVERGYDVTAFDICPAAVDWAAARHPSLSDSLLTADLLDLPPRLRGRFELVIDNRTMQSIHPDQQATAAAGCAALTKPHGIVLVIADIASSDDDTASRQAPPYPRTADEYQSLFASVGMLPTRTPDVFDVPGSLSGRMFRAAFHRP